ncbi:MAG: diguanylate phosphodiesterase, partial [Geminicoccaceae bacterium]|nr:diguanylate phosphodiesterase [Geminicoccaceae bacterium]
MRRLLAVMLLTLVAGFSGAARAAKDELVIGITQFPSTFHPNIDSMAAKSYI